MESISVHCLQKYKVFQVEKHKLCIFFLQFHNSILHVRSFKADMLRESYYSLERISKSQSFASLVTTLCNLSSTDHMNQYLCVHVTVPVMTCDDFNHTQGVLFNTLPQGINTNLFLIN